MEELSLVSRQEPGIAAIDNFQELKQVLEQQLSVYKNLVYSQDGVKAAKKDKAALNKLKNNIDKKRKEIKKIYMQPYVIVEAQAKELISLIDEPLALIADFIAREEAEEKKARRNEIANYNIKNCDIPYISKAAKRAGIAFDNSYFDTYRYAKSKKEEMGWENVKLEYLSAQFGISQQDAHRAWCDAEANVGVYLKLKELG